MNPKIIKHKGGIYTLYSKERVKVSIQHAWDFFSQPMNLNKLTPKEMNFKINSGNPYEFYEGKIITYTIKLLYFRFNWTTEITKVDNNVLFIDKQLFGPYKLWHHEHHFVDNKDGTVTIIDKVKYKLYFYPLSNLIHSIYVRKKLLDIFSFRNKMIRNVFK